MIPKKILLIFLIIVFSQSIFASSIQTEKNNLIQLLVTQYHFNKQKIKMLFTRAHPDRTIIQSMTKPVEKVTWNRYRHFFIQQKRIHGGAFYWHQHRAILSRIQRQYGVPASVIVAIIGVETAYGKNQGAHPVFNTLYTLAFYYPKQALFFQKELVQYLLLARENHFPMTTLKGSYAGAVGIPQFMPSSYRHFGVPGGAHHNVDLFRNHNDAIASIGNYLHLAGWQKSELIAQLIPTKAHFKHRFVSTDRALKMKSIKELGLIHTLKKPSDTKTAIVALHVPKKTYYWAVFQNFNAIMQYNHSVAYAMAVYQLSREIEKRYHHVYSRSRTAASSRQSCAC